MYEDLSLEGVFFQGDMLEDIPLFISPPEGSYEKEISSTKLNVMILSQTCDIQRRGFISVAPVYPVKDLTESEADENKKKALRKQNINYWFYLPEDTDFPESYVELNQTTHISSDILDISKRIKSLSDLGRHWLVFNLSIFFGRPLDRGEVFQ